MMTRAGIALFALLLMTGSGGTDMPEIGVATKVLPVTNRVGSVKMATVTDLWDDFLHDSDAYWGPMGNKWWWQMNGWNNSGDPHDQDLAVHEGFIFFIPASPPSSGTTYTNAWYAMDRTNFQGAGILDLTDSQMVIRWKPAKQNNTTPYYTALRWLWIDYTGNEDEYVYHYIYVEQSLASLYFVINIEHWDETLTQVFDGSIDTTITYDEDAHVYVRLRHEADTIYLDTAPLCGCWTNRLSLAVDATVPLWGFFMEVIFESRSASTDTVKATPGFFGPANPTDGWWLQSLPVTNSIHPVVEPGGTLMTSTLTNEVGDY